MTSPCPSEPVFPSPTWSVPAETIVACVGVVRGCQGQRAGAHLCQGARTGDRVGDGNVITAVENQGMSSVTPPIPREPVVPPSSICSVPAEIVVAPEYELATVSLVVPEPC